MNSEAPPKVRRRVRRRVRGRVLRRACGALAMQQLFRCKCARFQVRRVCDISMSVGNCAVSRLSSRGLRRVAMPRSVWGGWRWMGCGPAARRLRLLAVRLGLRPAWPAHFRGTRWSCRRGSSSALSRSPGQAIYLIPRLPPRASAWRAVAARPSVLVVTLCAPDARRKRARRRLDGGVL